MEPEINSPNQNYSLQKNINNTQENIRKEKIQEQINDKKIQDFKQRMNRQKELANEDPLLMKNVKIDLIPKLEKVIIHLQGILADTSSTRNQKKSAQEELEKRITQQNRLITFYKNND